MFTKKVRDAFSRDVKIHIQRVFVKQKIFWFFKILRRKDKMTARESFTALIRERVASMDHNELYSSFEELKFLFNQIVAKTCVLDFF